MAATPTPRSADGRRRPRASRARRIAAMLSVVAAVVLGGLMAWHDNQSVSASAQVGAPTSGASTTPARTDSSSREHDGDDEDEREGEHERESDDDDELHWDSSTPGLSDSSSPSRGVPSSPSRGVTLAAPHTNTRGS